MLGVAGAVQGPRTRCCIGEPAPAGVPNPQPCLPCLPQAVPASLSASHRVPHAAADELDELALEVTLDPTTTTAANGSEAAAPPAAPPSDEERRQAQVAVRSMLPLLEPLLERLLERCREK